MCAEILLHFPPDRVGADADRYDAMAFSQDIGVELGNLHAFERRTAGSSRLDGVFISIVVVPGQDEIPPGLRELVEIATQNVRARGLWVHRAARARAWGRCTRCRSTGT